MTVQTDFLERCKALNLHDGKLSDWLDEIESLRQQLAAALAACKVKDEALDAAHNGLRWWMDAFPLHVTEADNEEMLKLVKALAIQPDDAALKAWIGDPVGKLEIVDEDGKQVVDVYLPKELK